MKKRIGYLVHGASYANKGRTEGILSTLSDLVKNGIITLEQAANQPKMSVNEFESKAGLYAV